MRLSAGVTLDYLAWCILAGLLAGALLLEIYTGFLGVLLLGCLTVAVTRRMEADRRGEMLDQWGIRNPQSEAALRRRVTQMHGPQPGLAGTGADAGGAPAVSPLRFYTRCGLALIAIGAVGSAIQLSRIGVFHR